MSNKRKTKSKRLQQVLRNQPNTLKSWNAKNELVRIESKKIDAVLEGHQIKESE